MAQLVLDGLAGMLPPSAIRAVTAEVRGELGRAAEA
jgi:hypothetical protein